MSNNDERFQNFSVEEQEIVQMLETVKQEKPPEALMRDFELEVLRKAKAQPVGIPMGVLVPALCLGFAFMMLLGVLVFMRPEKSVVPEAEPAPVMQSKDEAVEATALPLQQVRTPEVVEQVQEEKATPIITTQDEALFEGMASDIFILEMLGEDEGLFEDYERLETDLEFIASATTVAPQAL